MSGVWKVFFGGELCPVFGRSFGGSAMSGAWKLLAWHIVLLKSAFKVQTLSLHQLNLNRPFSNAGSL